MEDEIIIIGSRPPDLAANDEQNSPGHELTGIRFNARTLRGLRAARTYIDGMIARKNGKPDEE